MRTSSSGLVFLFMVATAIGGALLPVPACADAAGFPAWLKRFEHQAIAAGISPQLVNQVLSRARFQPRAIELDRKQPEKTRTFAQYKESIVSKQRIEEGRRLYRQHRALLNEIEGKYGVPGAVVVALWGIETNYGKNTGGFSVVDALATLAYEGRRAQFFQDELINALKIIQGGHITAEAMKGSWAGAMGQNQFMPSSFMRFAVDYNGDNRRDIWGTKADVFASSANYLSKSGWKAGERWGRAVKLSPSFNMDYVGLDRRDPIAAWTARGVTLPNGDPLPAGDMKASIVRPGDGGQAYLVYNNYHTIMRWNKSTYFATSVGLLADQIAGGP